MKVWIYVAQGIVPVEVVPDKEIVVDSVHYMGPIDFVPFGYLHPFLLDEKNQTEGVRGRISGKHGKEQNLS